ncbi:MAG: type II secretion system protein N [Pseudomonadota bacterium]
MKPSRLIAVAAACFIVGLIAKLPAAVAFNWFMPDNIMTSGVSGSIWRGRISAVQVSGVNLGPIEWQSKPWALLTGAFRADVEMELPGGFAQGDIAIGTSSIRARSLQGAVSLAPITRFSAIGPSEGNARISLDDLTIRNGWPTSANGELTIVDLRYPPVGTAPLGGYELLFRNDDNGDVIADLTDMQSAPYLLDGLLRLTADGGYSLAGDIAAKPGVDVAYSRGLNFLGPADANGNRRLEFDGTL